MPATLPRKMTVIGDMAALVSWLPWQVGKRKTFEVHSEDWDRYSAQFFGL